MTSPSPVCSAIAKSVTIRRSAAPRTSRKLRIAQNHLIRRSRGIEVSREVDVNDRCRQPFWVHMNADSNKSLSEKASDPLRRGLVKPMEVTSPAKGQSPFRIGYEFESLFNAGEYYRSGRCPWTFFAYPTKLADDRGLPPDDEACGLLTLLQRRGIDVAVWTNGIVNDTTYFACRQEDVHRLQDALRQLETRGIIESDFCLARSERLFSQIAKGEENCDPPKRPVGREIEP